MQYGRISLTRHLKRAKEGGISLDQISEEGFAQAPGCRANFDTVGFYPDFVWVTPLNRTSQVAKVLFPGIPLWIATGLDYRQLGSGATDNERETSALQLWEPAANAKNALELFELMGETGILARDTVRAAIKEAIKTNIAQGAGDGANIAFVAHGQWVELGVGDDDLASIPILGEGDTIFVEFEYEPDGEVLVLRSTTHMPRAAV